MNYLLRLANGKYFAWQFDDDLYTPNFLENINTVFKREENLDAVFSSYKFVHGIKNPISKGRGIIKNPLSFSGSDFSYYSITNKIKTMGACGVFKIDELKRIGGIVSICNGPIGLYSEYLLLLNMSSFDNISFIDFPLIYYRDHNTSWSGRNKEVDKYYNTGIKLIRESIKFYSFFPSKKNFHSIIISLITIVVNNIIKIGRAHV